MTLINTTIDFNELVNPLRGDYSIGSTYSSGGFTFTADIGNLNTLGPNNISYPGSGAIYPDVFSTMTITKDDGGEFGITSFGLAELLGNSSAGTIEFTGTRSDNVAITEGFNLDGGAANTQIFTPNLLDTFNYTSVSATLDTLPGFQVDYMQMVYDNGLNNNAGGPVTSVPEPGSAALLTAGLLGIAATKGMRKGMRKVLPKLGL